MNTRRRILVTRLRGDDNTRNKKRRRKVQEKEKTRGAGADGEPRGEIQKGTGGGERRRWSA